MPDRPLEAHSSRLYNLSIPIFFAQAEGIIRDLSVLRRRAEVTKGKIYLLDQNGQRKLDKKGEPITISGLGKLLDHDEYEDDEIMAAVRKSLVDALLPKRNDIMHGRELSYGKAQWSVKGLLIVSIAASALSWFERGGED